MKIKSGNKGFKGFEKWNAANSLVYSRYYFPETCYFLPNFTKSWSNMKASVSWIDENTMWMTDELLNYQNLSKSS